MDPFQTSYGKSSIAFFLFFSFDDFQIDGYLGADEV